MTTIVTRSGKGSPLTHTEVDTNFTNLNTAKLETAAIPLGTLGAPSISFLSYSTTGIYSPAGNELGVSMLGSDKIRIKSTGEIIINATASRTTLGITPRLQIEGSASSSQCSMSLTGAGAGGTLFPRLYLSKARSSVNAIVLEDDILGFISFNGGDGSSLVNAGFIKAEVDGTPSAGIVPGRLVFATVDTAGGSGERMIIKNNGNVSIDGTTFNVDAVNNRVGIGTSAPGALLSVEGNSATSAIGFAGRFYDTATNRGFGSPLLYVRTPNDTSSSSAIGMFGVGDNADTSELGNLFRITQTGLVGIGTSSPLSIFDVKPNSNRHIIFSPSSSYASNAVVAVDDTGTEIAIGIGGSPIQFFTGATERARIDSSGRLLVGTSTAVAGTAQTASIVGSTLTQSTGLQSVGSGGTLDLALLGNEINGHLYVSYALAANAYVRTSKIFFIETRLTDNTVITELNTNSGSGGGRSFTITNPSATTFRLTDTSSSACTASMSFVGNMGA